MAVARPVPKPSPPPVQADLTDRALIEAWVSDKAASTARNYRAAAVRFRRLVARPLSNLTRADIDRVYRAEWSKPFEANSNRFNGPVRMLLRYLLAEGVVKRNLADFVPVDYRGLAAEADYASNTPVEVRRMLRQAKRTPRLHVLLVLMARVGLTAKEIVALDASDLTDNGSQLFVVGPFERSIGIEEADAVVLWAYRRELLNNCPMFPSRLGGGERRLSERAIARFIVSAGTAVDVHTSPRMLRNSFIRSCFLDGMQVTEVQEYLGLSTPKSLVRWLHFDKLNSQDFAPSRKRSK